MDQTSQDEVHDDTSNHLKAQKETVKTQEEEHKEQQELIKAIDALSSGFEGVFCPVLDMIATHLAEIK